MKISHKTVNVSGKDYVYIYITVEDVYEFGKENLGKGENSNLLKSLREYIKSNVNSLKKAAIVIVINGVVIGTTTFLALMPKSNNPQNNITNKVEIYKEQIDVKKETLQDENNKSEKTEVEETKKQENTTEKNDTTTNTKNEKKKITKEDTTNKNVKTTIPSKSNKVTTTTKTSNTKNTTNKNTTKNTTQSNTNTTTKSSTSSSKTNTTSSSKTNDNVQSKIKIKFNNKGVISNIDLEEYVIGVVAAEMPASFSSEALKAQAVAARTYAMKKYSNGITLLNSTAHQVYNTKDQMKSKWGKDYDTYYNKIKSAVNATKGQVLKYNNEYIEAAYYAISNGSSELPKYVWNTNYPYLKAVSSSWDKNLSAASHTVTLSYSNMSKKIGVTVNKDTKIEVLSKTEGNRVNKIKIGDKVFTGVKVRSLLGLRSTDFEIIQGDTNVIIKEKGYGHGVGMSQYGANGAAKAGYTYKQILKHYYPGTILVTL